MERSVYEEKFLDYLDGTLSEQECEEMARALSDDEKLRNSLEAYKKILFVEKSLAESSPTISPNFSVKVMSAIDEQKLGFWRRLFMDFAVSRRGAYAALATVCTVVLVVKGVQTITYEKASTAVIYEPQQKNEQIGREIAASAPAPANELAKDAPAQAASSADFGQRLRDEKLESKLNMQEGSVGSAPPQDKKGIEEAKKSDIGLNDVLGVNKGTASGAKSKRQDELRENDLTQAYTGDQDRLKEISKSVKEQESGTPTSKDFFEMRQAGPPPVQARGGAMLKVPAPLSESPAGISPRQPSESFPAGRSVSGGIPIYNTEEYAEFSENERLSVLKEPSSTFSIDVDTASYTNARRFLKDGILPPKTSIRIEEFINYFNYNYPVQYEKPFTLSYEIAPSPLEKDRHLLKLGIKAKDMKDSRKPWNIVFLVDVSSGSMMDENKLPLVKRSLKIMLEKMKEKDTISIVTYAGDAGVALPATGVGERQKIIDAIDRLNAGGSTNGAGGITVAYDLAQKHKIDGGVNRVVLATDGDFNVGITSRDDLTKFIEEKRNGGITLTTLGFGTGNLKDGTMELLANKGNGNYFYIDNYQEARKVLETDLMGTIEVVAKDVKLQIEFNPKNIAYYRLIGYENRKLKREDFNNDKIDAGEIGSGHTVTAIYEIILGESELAKKIEDEFRYQKSDANAKKPEVNSDFNSELAFLKIRYKEPDGNESALLQYPIETKEIKKSADEASSDFKFAAAVSYFAHILRSSQFSGTYSLKDVRALAESARGEDKNGYRQEFIEMIKNAESLK